MFAYSWTKFLYLDLNLGYAWLVLVWAFGATLILQLLNVRFQKFPFWYRKPITWNSVFIRSLKAGTLEELIFRWGLFYIGMPLMLFSNTVTFGLTKWFFRNFEGPVANFLTDGILRYYLIGGAGWLVGASLFYANLKFQEGHEYLGPIGYFNSWFIGMVLFWVMLYHGLFEAMFLHFTYDLIAFAIIKLFEDRETQYYHAPSRPMWYKGY